MKFVYFDIGGVLIKDLSDTENGWNTFLNTFKFKNEKEIEKFESFFAGFEKKLEAGEDIGKFSSIMNSDYMVQLPKNYFLEKDLVERFFKKNEEIWKIVEISKKNYKLGLLTNMYNGLLDLIKNKKLIPNIDWIIVDSSVEKCRKPDKRIYEIAEEKSGFKGKDILFIDNRQENLETPKEMGWQTYWYDSSDYEKSNLKLAKFLR